MGQPDQAPPPGNACVWVVVALLLLAVLAGGGCLVLYLVLPASQVPHWLPVAGLALVALPWAFWIATCAYRCCCSSCLPRGALPGGVPRQPSRQASVSPLPSTLKFKSALSTKHDRQGSSGTPRRVRFGDSTVLGEENSGKGTEVDDGSSVHSHETEVPLARSMHAS